MVNRPGYDALWLWFGLSYASFITIPRSLAHEMPDEWQAKMAELLDEYQATWQTHDLPSPYVMARNRENRWCSWPDWLLNYRHPQREAIDELRVPTKDKNDE